MNKSFLFIAVLCLIGASVFGQAKPLDEYLKEAKTYQESGQTNQAIAMMERAIDEHPESSKAYGYLGDLIGEKVQKTKEYGEIFLAIEYAFAMWDKAIELDEKNYEARFTRGAWGVSVPKFAGRLEGGVNDLEYMTQVLQYAPGEEAQQHLVSAYNYLGSGYQKLGKLEKAEKVFQKAIEKAPETEHAETAQRNLKRIAAFKKWHAEQGKLRGPESSEITSLKQQVEEEPSNVKLLTELGNAYLDDERYDEAETIFRRVIHQDSSNIAACKLLALTLVELNTRGYDPRIALDTDFRTDLSFELMLVLDKAVNLKPEDIELRLLRGVSAVQMPFFVGRLDQGIDDLTMVIESAADDATKAEAIYHLGLAHQKKAMTYWIKVVLDNASSDATQQVFDALRPQVDRVDLSQHQRPYVVIDFVLGFKDELAPQSAVWVEDKDGNFIKTVYVSGFSGYAKEKQINLPIWARSSKFIDVDAVTGASIDLGHHIYIWDLKDYSGKKVKSGEYVLKVEVAYWPSMQYQRVEVPLKVGKKDRQVVIKEGNLIPYLEAKYLRNP